MANLSAWATWFKAHKSVVGSFFGGLSVIVLGAGNIYSSDQLTHAGALLALIGGTLMGSGMAKSDEFYRDKVELLKTKVDRRNPASLIPAKDLQKILAKDEPLPPKEKDI